MKIASAVLDAKVKRFFPWQFGVDYDVVGRGSAQDLWDEQLDVRALLRGQNGTEWVVVSTGLFMSFLFERSFGIVDLEGDGMGEEGVVVRALEAWENRVTVTDVGDIGMLTARIVFEEPRARNEVLYTAGETVSYARLADAVEEVTGKRVKREVWSVERLERELEEARGKEEETVAKYRVAFAVGRGVSWDVEKSWNFKHGVEVMSVKSYAEKNLSRLAESGNV